MILLLPENGKSSKKSNEYITYNINIINQNNQINYEDKNLNTRPKVPED